MSLKSAILATGLAALLAPAAAGAQPEAQRPLTGDDRTKIANALAACAATEPERKRIQEKLDEVIGVAAGRDEAVDYIVKMGLAQEQPALARMAAVEVLGLIGRTMSPAARERTLAALNELVEFDPVYSVRRHAARTIAGFGDRDLLGRLYQELPDFDGRLRRDILANDQGQLKALGLTISRALRRFESLMKQLEGNDQDLRNKARAELQRLTGDEYRAAPADWQKWWTEQRGRPESELLAPNLNRTADRVFKLALIELAALADAHNAVDGLCAALERGSAPEKLAAAAALGALGDAPAAEKLRGALEDPDGSVKAAATEALARIDPRNSAAQFRRLLEDWAPRDGSPEHQAALLRVRRAAISGLAAAGSPEAAPRLAEILGEPAGSRALNWDALDALRRMGTLAELPALARYGAAGDQREREGALLAIAEICRRGPPPEGLKGRPLASASPAELLALAAAKDAAAAVAAVWELDRRDLVRAEDEGLVKALAKAGPGAARMLCLALLGRRKWSPAVAELARSALAAGDDQAVARVACAAAAEAGSPEAVGRYLQTAAGTSAAASRSAIEELRRQAAAALCGLLAAPGVPPAVAASCAEGLPALVSREDPELQVRVPGALVAALADERLRPAFPAICAALRRLTDQDYPDDPKYWQKWWKSRESARPAGQSR